ncbi:ABC transporter substrate-binding protein [Bifidobacterium subtile]|uniref:ABC transporter substrate-binding protein n=1 Tax=Bifidobacterium subtile TaxID=77635 RepID=A0A087E7B9_9BIFI|nr:ABC transporter substrate-binding protein [Bifidobacterium subtile]KFJ03670.1 ABC transporter substrate-binding protein [Bifidobacterium subtile]QOL36246.1 carbohydrate ABC transporter substrate-binding protein [Bifidobacterium subtile]
MRTGTKKLIAATLSLGLGITLAACGGSGADPSKGHVYLVNGKQEIGDQLQKLADDYTKETGVDVQVNTAAAGSYDSTLTSELSKSEAPTMFTIGGYDQFAKYKKYLTNLKDTDVYKLLNEEGQANSHKDADGAYTLPYAGEWYGIIYNKKIVNEYAKKPYALIKSDKDIKDYDTLKSVAEDMQKHKDDLGIKAAFATPALDASASYRYTTHMGRVPLFYEYRDANVTFEPTLKGTYLKNYKDMFDLQLKNNPTPSTMLTSKSYDDVTSEFALGDVAFYPNGVWAYGQIKDNNVSDKDLGMLPYWLGIPGEDKYGPFSIYDASWAVNKKASKQDQKATLDFIDWLVTGDEGKESLSKEMGFSVPFTTFDNDKYQPANPLTTAARAYAKEGKPSAQSFTVPSQQWQDDLANALTEYAQGTGKWSKFESAYVGGWQKEWQNNQKVLGLLPQVEPFSK